VTQRVRRTAADPAILHSRKTTACSEAMLDNRGFSARRLYACTHSPGHDQGDMAARPDAAEHYPAFPPGMVTSGYRTITRSSRHSTARDPRSSIAAGFRERRKHATLIRLIPGMRWILPRFGRECPHSTSCANAHIRRNPRVSGCHRHCAQYLQTPPDIRCKRLSTARTTAGISIWSSRHPLDKTKSLRSRSVPVSRRGAKSRDTGMPVGPAGVT
jgi:hypothetical protein